MKPPRPTQRKFAFKLSNSTTTTKNKETVAVIQSKRWLEV